MKLLLDTHCWLWLGLEPARLGRKTVALLNDAGHERFLSVASVWEIIVKSERGKLRLPLDAPNYVRSRLKLSRTTALPIALDHAIAVAALPAVHHDPFDRMIVAQAQVEAMTIVTADPAIAKYKVFTHDPRM